VRSRFEIRRLDDILAKDNLMQIDFMKMDVEGFECQVIEGAQNLLSSIRPRLIQSEVWPQMYGCTHKAYFDNFLKAKYQVTKDMKCQVPDLSDSTVIENRFMCATNKAERDGTLTSSPLGARSTR
jgi:hypothetical protein